MKIHLQQKCYYKIKLFVYLIRPLSFLHLLNSNLNPIILASDLQVLSLCHLFDILDRNTGPKTQKMPRKTASLLGEKVLCSSLLCYVISLFNSISSQRVRGSRSCMLHGTLTYKTRKTVETCHVLYPFKNHFNSLFVCNITVSTIYPLK